MRQPERSTIPSALFSANKKKKGKKRKERNHSPPSAGHTLSLVPFAEIMRQPWEAAKREFPSLGNKGEAESPAATHNGKSERGQKKKKKKPGNK